MLRVSEVLPNTALFSVRELIHLLLTLPVLFDSMTDIEITETDRENTDETILDGAAEQTAKKVPTPREQVDRSIEMAKAAARVAAENRGQDIVVIDVSEQTSIFDCFVIATGTSRRQLHAISEEIDRVLEKEMSEKRLSISGYSESRWIVLDYGGVMIHLFDEDAREFYDLEGLWADGKHIDLSEALRNTSATMTPLDQ
jgi:ribosome-associated protein